MDGGNWRQAQDPDEIGVREKVGFLASALCAGRGGLGDREELMGWNEMRWDYSVLSAMAFNCFLLEDGQRWAKGGQRACWLAARA